MFKEVILLYEEKSGIIIFSYKEKVLLTIFSINKKCHLNIFFKENRVLKYFSIRETLFKIVTLGTYDHEADGYEWAI